MNADDRVRYWRDQSRGFKQEAAFYKEEHDHLLSWFNQRISRERDLEARCTYLYKLATRLGATDEQLRGDP